MKIEITANPAPWYLWGIHIGCSDEENVIVDGFSSQQQVIVLAAKEGTPAPDPGTVLALHGRSKTMREQETTQIVTVAIVESHETRTQINLLKTGKTSEEENIEVFMCRIFEGLKANIDGDEYPFPDENAKVFVLSA